MTARKKLIFLILGGLLVLAVSLSMLSQWWGALPDGLLQASGRIEGDEIVIAPKIAGRALQIFKDRGDSVTTGDLWYVCLRIRSRPNWTEPGNRSVTGRTGCVRPGSTWITLPNRCPRISPRPPPGWIRPGPASRRLKPY